MKNQSTQSEIHLKTSYNKRKEMVLQDFKISNKKVAASERNYVIQLFSGNGGIKWAGRQFGVEAEKKKSLIL